MSTSDVPSLLNRIILERVNRMQRHVTLQADELSLSVILCARCEIIHVVDGNKNFLKNLCDKGRFVL